MLLILLLLRDARLGANRAGDSQWVVAACRAARMSEIVKIKAYAQLNSSAVENIHAAACCQITVPGDGQKASCLKGV